MSRAVFPRVNPKRQVTWSCSGCPGTSLTTATYTDSLLPGSNQGYLYLVSQMNRNGEGSLGVQESRVTVCGNTSTMTQARRPNLSPCP